MVRHGGAPKAAAPVARRRPAGRRTRQHHDPRTIPARLAPPRTGPGTSALYGIDGVLTVVEQLAGVPVPASALEPLILAPRVRDYTPTMLDELTTTGEVLWSGTGSISGKDGWVALHPADLAPVSLTPVDDIELDGAPGDPRLALGRRRVLLPATRRRRHRPPHHGERHDGRRRLWELVWSGHVAGDTLAPLRA